MGSFQTIDHAEFQRLLGGRLDAVRKGRMETHAQECADCANLAVERLATEAVTEGPSPASEEADPYPDCFFGSTLLDYSVRQYSDQAETSCMTDDEFRLIKFHLDVCSRCRDLVEESGSPLIAYSDAIHKVAEDYRRHNRS